MTAPRGRQASQREAHFPCERCLGVRKRARQHKVFLVLKRLEVSFEQELAYVLKRYILSDCTVTYADRAEYVESKLCCQGRANGLSTSMENYVMQLISSWQNLL